MNWLAELATKRTPWLLLAVISLAFEITALFFQYNMGLEPCIMCIYQRTAVLGLLAAGVMGAINPQNMVVRLVAFATWGVSAIWGYFIAKEHIAMQNNTDPFAFSCAFEPNFPSFMPLHEWIPSFFAATGDCGNIDWQFASMSMPAWMEVIFAAFSVVFVAVLVSRLVSKKSL
ncbi:disulfide bond formation protein B [Pseudoalteromonas sp. NCCP-2140]|uniref:disulfide bond formation protein DsbB n=1 Tax=Pseudoalteromonas TaxID=53246 RepID=UPI0015822080|nr:MULTISPECIES: disulfide bond formation protein DsbB [Pseudoalteromonas]MDI4652522.1 disulfide bond formation protein DsbB [Pseudoalteromonas shioyasakiensis]NUJ38612.1 disulfide bond formation protein DsbB [Pseudoalteromonas sp. 0303]GKW51948.1 disulfide bond formation protein B [Pseudoalteromonas sp. NCCP-2140]